MKQWRNLHPIRWPCCNRSEGEFDLFGAKWSKRHVPRIKSSVLPVLPSKIGARGKLIVPPDGCVLRYTITDEVRVTQSDMREKILCLQRIEFEDKRIEVRLGYYIIGKKPKMRGRWVWGQFAALMPLRDFRALIRVAEKKGWI